MILCCTDAIYVIPTIFIYINIATVKNGIYL